MWTVSQRRALIALIGATAIALAVRAILWPAHVGFSPDLPGSRAGELSRRIDPNTADAVMLENIPEFGPVRAAAVVAYREKFIAIHPGSPAFSRLEDLRNIKGIGPAMLEKLRPYLSFEFRTAETAQ